MKDDVNQIKENVGPSSDRKVVFIVFCYSSILGVYADKHSADCVANERIMKGYPVDVLCRPIL